MAGTIFDELTAGWHELAGHLHHQHHTTTDPVIKRGVTSMSLTQLATDLQATVRNGEVQFRTVLDEHLPRLIELAERFESNPLMQAAEAAAGLPPEVRQGLADAITRVAAAFPPPGTGDAVAAAAASTPDPGTPDAAVPGAAPQTAGA